MKIKMNKKRTEAITAYLMLLPDIIGLAVFVFVPMLFAFYVSFHNWNGLTEMEFIGLDNYRKLLIDSDFINSLITTLKYSIMYIPSVYIISLGLALLTNSLKGKIETFSRMAYFLPFSISTVIAGLIWSFMYEPKNGFLNSILNIFGFESQRFLSSTTYALPSIVAVSVWLVVGYNMIIFLSALKEVPKELYEAADIDGASSIQKFFFITLPQIKNTSVFIIIVTTIGSFQVFDQIQVMTNGGPARSTEVTVFRIYDQAFTMYNFGYSSTMAIVLLFIIMLLTIVQFWIMNKNGDRLV